MPSTRRAAGPSRTPMSVQKINPDTLTVSTSTQQATVLKEVIVPTLNAIIEATGIDVRDVIEASGTTATEQGVVGSPDPEAALPADFPGYEHLVAAGLTTYGAVREATDDALDAVDGVGPVTIEKIRAAQ